jgi:hypothetical protein
MARQAEDPKARINPALLLIFIQIAFHVEIWPNRGGHMGGSSLAADKNTFSSSGDVTAIRRVSARNDLVETLRHHHLVSISALWLDLNIEPAHVACATPRCSEQ